MKFSRNQVHSFQIRDVLGVQRDKWDRTVQVKRVLVQATEIFQENRALEKCTCPHL